MKKLALNLALVAVGLALSCAPVQHPQKANDTESVMLRRVAESSVMLTDGQNLGSGSVVLSMEDRSITLTAFHVVHRMKTIDMRWVTDGTIQSTSARVVASNPSLDLALVETERIDSRRPIGIAKEAPDLYDPIFAVGAPLGYYGIASSGLLDAKVVRDIEGNDYGHLWQVTALIPPGMSGGMVVNSEGNLVAVALSVPALLEMPFSHIGFCASLDSVRGFLAKALHGEAFLLREAVQ